MQNIGSNHLINIPYWTYLKFQFREGSSYTVIFPVGAVNGQTVSTLNSVPGLTITSTTQTNTAASTTVANTAPSILDFNLLRSNMIQAIDILDQKIRDIVMTTAPTCPWKIETALWNLCCFFLPRETLCKVLLDSAEINLLFNAICWWVCNGAYMSNHTCKVI